MIKINLLPPELQTRKGRPEGGEAGGPGGRSAAARRGHGAHRRDRRPLPALLADHRLRDRVPPCRRQPGGGRQGYRRPRQDAEGIREPEEPVRAGIPAVDPDAGADRDHGRTDARKAPAVVRKAEHALEPDSGGGVPHRGGGQREDRYGRDRAVGEGAGGVREEEGRGRRDEGG